MYSKPVYRRRPAQRRIKRFILSKIAGNSYDDAVTFARTHGITFATTQGMSPVMTLGRTHGITFASLHDAQMVLTLVRTASLTLASQLDVQSALVRPAVMLRLVHARQHQPVNRPFAAGIQDADDAAHGGRPAFSAAARRPWPPAENREGRWSTARRTSAPSVRG